MLWAVPGATPAVRSVAAGVVPTTGTMATSMTSDPLGVLGPKVKKHALVELFVDSVALASKLDID